MHSEQKAEWRQKGTEARKTKGGGRSSFAAVTCLRCVIQGGACNLNAWTDQGRRNAGTTPTLVIRCCKCGRQAAQGKGRAQNSQSTYVCAAATPGTQSPPGVGDSCLIL